MGKYMRKAKITGEVAAMEVSHQSPLGVRTRARTLALQSLQKPPPDPPAYLQLRSRRLEKPAAKDPQNPNPNPNPNPSSPNSNPSSRVNSSSVGSVSMRSCSTKKKDCAAASEAEIEVSLGENFIPIESRDRNSRETTPCSLIRGSETIRTPGSSTRPTNSTANNHRSHHPILRNIPTTNEMEEFFAVSEQLQQKIFKEKYNFDPVKDHPLSGRYEWVKLDS